MSVKPIIDKPTSLGTALHKDFTAKFLKTMRKLAKKHTTQETAVPFFVDLEAKFRDTPNGAFLFLAGKMNTWKKYAKENATKTDALRGYCYITTDPKGFLLINIMPVAGKLKMKEKPIAMAMRKVVSVNKMALQFVAGNFEDNDKLDEATENMPEEADTPDLEQPDDENTAEVFDTANLADGKYAEMKPEFMKNLSAWKQGNCEAGALADWLKAFVTKYKADLGKEKEMTQWVYLVENPQMARLMFLDLKAEFAVLDKESSTLIKDSFDNIIKLTERFIADRSPAMRQNIFTALLGQAKGLKQKYTDANDYPKRIAALDVLIKALETVGDGVAQKPKDNETLNVQDGQVTGKTFGEKGTAGEQSASEKAQKMRDASADERALEIGKLLKMGKGSNDDKTFGQVLRWINDTGDLQNKYMLATQKLYKTNSNLVADLTMVFGSGLRGQLLVNRLEGKESQHTKLAAALGCLGGGWFSKIFSGEKADAMVIIGTDYNKAGLDHLIGKEDEFAKAAMAVLEKNKAMLEELKAMQEIKAKTEAMETEADPVKKEAARQEMYKANDRYLQGVLERIGDDSIFGRVDGDALQKDIKTWADRVSEAERLEAAKETGGFMKQLLAYANSKKPNGVDKKLVEHIKRILTAPRASSEDKEAMKSHAIFNELQKITIDQQDKNRVTRWKENKETGEKFKAILLGSDVTDPQLTIITRFAADMAKEGNPLAGATATPTETEIQKTLRERYTTIGKAILTDDKSLLAAYKDASTANNIREAILEIAMGKLKGIMDLAGVHNDFVEEIEESIRSNGAHAGAYRALAKIAEDKKGLTNIGVGDDVIEILEGLDVSGKEFSSVKADTKMLEAIKVRVIGRTGLGADDWTKIAKLLSLSGDLAKTDNVKKEATATFSDARKTDRTKIPTPAEQEALKQQQEQAQKQPSYWAERLALEYKKGILVDKIAVTEVVIKSKKAGVDWTQVMTELDGINPKAKTYITEMLASTGDGSGNLGMLDYLKMLEDKVFITQNTRMAKLRQMVGDASVEELIKQCFNLPKEGFKGTINAAQKTLDAAKTESDKQNQLAADKAEELRKAQEKQNAAASQDEKDKLQPEVEKAQKALDEANHAASAATQKLTEATEAAKKANDDLPNHIDQLVKLLDVSPDFTNLLNKALDPQFALEVKNGIRDKVVQELSNDADAAAKIFDIPVADMKMLSENIRAISLNEKELQSNTGTQYYGLTSRAIARDIATANHAKQLARGQEKISTLKGRPAEEVQKAKEEIADRLQVAGEEKLAKINAFEERKKQYDDRIKAVVNELISIAVKAATIPLGGIPFVAGVVEAAIKAVVINLVNKGLGGDRAGSWKTVMKDMGKDFVINAAAAVVAELVPFIASQASQILQELAIKANDAVRRVEALRKPIEAFDAVYNFIKNIANTVDGFVEGLKEKITDWTPIKKILGAIETATTRITDFQNQMEASIKSAGLIGEIAWEYGKEKAEALAEQLSGMEEYVSDVKDKFVEEAMAKMGKAGELLKKLGELKEKFDTFQNFLATGQNTDGLDDKLKEEIEAQAQEFNDLVGGKVEEFFGSIAPAVAEGEAAPVDNSSMVQVGNNPAQDLLDLQEALKKQGVAVPEFINDLILSL